MATSQLAYVAEKAVGHDREYIQQDVSNYEGVGDPDEKMKALTWQGKKSVAVGSFILFFASGQPLRQCFHIHKRHRRPTHQRYNKRMRLNEFMG